MRKRLEQGETSLCHPDLEKTCFFCCPPLRPPGYDPLQRASVLEPQFLRNRQRYLATVMTLQEGRAGLQPISGWECWALGYLDDEGKRIGCLLHLAYNRGVDYRHLVDYGTKCARELCLEALTFNELEDGTKKFYRLVTTGMNSFQYSSRHWNPVFPLLLWGKKLCEKIAASEQYRVINKGELMNVYGCLFNPLHYKADGYFIERVAETLGVATVRSEFFLNSYQEWKEGIVLQHRRQAGYMRDALRDSSVRPVHIFSVPLSFSRFLKFSLHIWKAPEEEVLVLKDKIDKELDDFIASFPAWAACYE